MPRIRSPNYPSISLSDALKRVSQLHNRERQHPASREVIMKGMGYGGANGPSLGAISAAIKFGLLERVGKGEDYRVSDRAVAILHPHNPAEKAVAINEASKSPPLFAELLNHFNGDLPSDDNLRAYLVRRGFSQTSLPHVIQSFRETLELVSPGFQGYDSTENLSRQPIMEPTPPGDPNYVARSAGANLPPHAQPGAQATPSVAGNQTVVNLGDESVQVTAHLVDQEGLQKLIDKLSAIKALLPGK